MHRSTDIRFIRRLVEKFYLGETSPAEEGILAEYFNKTDAHNIPEDLAKDAEVFRSLSSLLPDADEIKIPGELESQLAEITRVMPEKKGKSPLRVVPFIFRAASIAAVACLIWGIITFLPKTSNLNDNIPAKNNQGGLTAGVTVIPDTPAPIVGETTDKEETNKEKNIVVKQTTPRHIAQSKLPKVTVSADSQSDEEDSFIEITDPEEARQIMDNIGNLLAANFSESDKAMNTVSTSIESYKELTKTILQ